MIMRPLFADPVNEASVTRADIVNSDVFSDATRTIEAEADVYQSIEVEDDFGDILEDTRAR